jgi:hypothetical protein
MKNCNDLEMRCPRLGGEVTFSYCKWEGGDSPCLRVINCWQPVFPVETYLRESMSQDVWKSFSSQTPKDKVSTLIELIEAAKRRKTQNDKA